MASSPCCSCCCSQPPPPPQTILITTSTLIVVRMALQTGGVIPFNVHAPVARSRRVVPLPLAAQEQPHTAIVPQPLPPEVRSSLRDQTVHDLASFALPPPLIAPEKPNPVIAPQLLPPEAGSLREQTVHAFTSLTPPPVAQEQPNMAIAPKPNSHEARPILGGQTVFAFLQSTNPLKQA